MPWNDMVKQTWNFFQMQLCANGVASAQAGNQPSICRDVKYYYNNSLK